MKFKLIIGKSKEDEITASIHDRSALTDQIEALVPDSRSAHTDPGRRMTFFSVKLRN